MIKSKRVRGIKSAECRLWLDVPLPRNYDENEKSYGDAARNDP